MARTKDQDGKDDRDGDKGRDKDGAKDGAKEKERRGIRRRISERAMKIPFLRRRTVKRMIKYIDKSKAKGRRLPPEMLELSRFLARIPAGQREQRLEEALAQQSAGKGDDVFNRDLRRAAANQQRRSGKNPAGYRPGSLPRSHQPGRRPSKPR